MKNRFKPWTEALTASVLAAGLFYVRFGYDVGFSDQDEFVPLVMKWLNPELFARDWFVTLQDSEFGIRTIFAGLLALPSLFLPIELAILILHVVTWLVLTLSLHRISIYLYDNKLTALIFVIAGTVLTARWNPGGNDVFHSMLVPSSVAWAFGMWSLERLLARRYLVAGILGSLAVLVHPLVGIQICAVLGAGLTLSNPRYALRYLLPIIVVAVPMVLIFADLGAAPDSIAETGRILTHIRAPHHYLPSFFSPASWATFGSLILVGGCFMWIDSSRTSKGHVRTSIFALFGISLIVLAVSAVLISAFKIDLVTRLQPFSLAVFARILGVLGCLSVITTFISTSALRRIDALLSQPRWLPIAILFLIVAVLLVRPWYVQVNSGEGAPSSVLSPLDPITGSWIKQNTSIDALFAVPPSLSGFQIQTSRSQFVNFKAFPFTKKGSEEWLLRLLLMAPVSSTSPGGAALMIRMDSAYVASSPTYWSSTPELQGIDYILRPLPEGHNWAKTPPTWCSPTWCIYSSESLVAQTISTN
ncbi:MAG: hypothetical protein O3B41_10245 [Bacteroidetes bacterium]|nr:hypothetical protein [Bacteroidota bacterium]